MSTRLDTPPTVETTVSIGAGIAIAGIWLACAALSIVLLLTIFVWCPAAATIGGSITNEGAMVLGVIFAAPLIAAYSLTKRILSKD